MLILKDNESHSLNDKTFSCKIISLCYMDVKIIHLDNEKEKVRDP